MNIDTNIHGPAAYQGRGDPYEREARPVHGAGVVLAVLVGIVAYAAVIHAIARGWL
jgi:hypothetical protein